MYIHLYHLSALTTLEGRFRGKMPLNDKLHRHLSPMNLSCFFFNEFLQVYIVAMKQQDSPSPVNAGDEEFSEPAGSLLELVEPELKSLSKYWLGALRDHALLSLPAEYASQLPPHGGMFYRFEMLFL